MSFEICGSVAAPDRKKAATLIELENTMRICFVGADNYPVLNPMKGDSYFGGESVQQTLLAKAFRDIGYEVSMIVADYGQEDGEVIDGIAVYKTFSPGDGIPILRYFHPRMTSIMAALKRADADIYYQSCAGMMTGLVARFCSSNERKFIFRLAHDSDCIPGQQIIKYARDRKIYEYGIRRADLIAAQGIRQVELLQGHYGLAATPINMTVEMPSEDLCIEKDIDVLWVNNFRDFKRPELVIKFAELMPNYNITMIGGPVPGYEDLYEKVKAQSRSLSNLSFLGAVAYHDVNTYFSRAKVFINTSEWEGFPNSFLQAWARQVPVVSFFDPDGLIESERLGAVPSTIEEMADRVSKILDDAPDRLSMAKNCQEFALQNYSPTAVAERYLELLV